ncbi:Syntaxin-binding protein 6 [Dissostichus eleginoides]|uniref:Syntaxin-binding protein 6 n=1 Tax=Dissostichus eleginoides TaxID=100907 RepID=A0AAD9F514_DISEL|nr:Syntaxin-binding protein 6 [Dissostichus eleginoides]
MSVQSAINKELFIPRDERMLVAVEVSRRKRKRMSFLPTGAGGDYNTFICVSVTNTRPHQLLITKVKQFGGSSTFTKRTQWTVEKLRQVNGINPNKDCPEFDLVFDGAVDQWVASSSAEKCLFVQILYHACKTYWEGKVGSLGKVVRQRSQSAPLEVGAGPSVPSRVPAPRTLQSRRKKACTMNLVIFRCKVFMNRLKNRMVANKSRSPARGQPGVTGSTLGNVVHRMNVALGERGDKLSHTEEKTVEMMHKAQQFADTAHKLALKYSK